jgi:hypothetical protein
MDFPRNGRGDMDWIDLAQDWNMWRDFVNAVMKVRLLSNVWNFLTSCGSIRWFKKDSAPWSSRMRSSHMYFRKWFWLDRKSAELLKALRRGGVCKEKACHFTVDGTARQCVGMKVRLR